MVLESNKAGYVFITMPEEENLNQKWVELEDGVILNVGNRLPLTTDTIGQDPESVKNWELNGKIGGLDGYIKMTTRSGWAIGCQIYNKDIRKNNKDRDWYPMDGDRCKATNQYITDPRNRFIIKGLSDGYPKDLSGYDKFTLENMWLSVSRPEDTPMVLESDNLGYAFAALSDPENPKQQWVQLEGDVILNVGTRKPLTVQNDESAKTWKINSQFSFYDGGQILDGYIEVATKPGFCVFFDILPVNNVWGPVVGKKASVKDCSKAGPPNYGNDSRNRFLVKVTETKEETTEMREETTTETVVETTTEMVEETTTQVTLSAVPCADKRNKKWCNKSRCMNGYWYPKTQCLKSCSEVEGVQDFCEGNETLPCKDFDQTEDCEAVKREGKCEDPKPKRGRAKQIWNLKCFKTCGNC